MGLRLGPVISVGNGKPAYVWDADVLAFIAANNITAQLEKLALNNLILSLKGSNSLSKDYYSQIVFLNGISPTSLAVSKLHFKYPTTQAITIIGTDATHSSDGVAFNGTTQGWDLNNALNTVPQANLLMLMARNNTITVNGNAFGVNDVTNTNVATLAPRTAATSFFLAGTSHPILSAPGIYVGTNDGTNTVIYKDGVRITPTVETARPTGTPSTKDVFIGCRNNNASAANFVDERIITYLAINMTATPYTASEVEVLTQIVQSYNTNVV